MAQSIKGKTAIVTGAGSGINLEFARLLLEGGANVLLADLSLRPEAEALVAQFSQGQPRALFQRTDVTSWADLEGMFTTALEQFHDIDVVCPGAGVFEPPFSNFWYPPGAAPSRDERNGDHYQILDINITHPIRTTQLAISHFLSAKIPASPSNPKTIVHIASIAGESASLPFPMYHATKHAIFGFVRSLADLEHVCGIRVAAVAPGIVRTPLWLDNPEKMRMLKDEGEGADEWISPRDVAAAMLAIVERNEVSAVIGPARDNSEVATPRLVPINGGSILEVTAREIRDIPLFNNPGPYGLVGTTASNAGEVLHETRSLLKPGWGKS